MHNSVRFDEPNNFLLYVSVPESMILHAYMHTILWFSCAEFDPTGPEQSPATLTAPKQVPTRHTWCRDVCTPLCSRVPSSI